MQANLIIQTTLNLNSSQAVAINFPKNSELTFQFDSVLQKPYGYLSQIQLNTCIILNSFYIINDTNNLIKYTLDKVRYQFEFTKGNPNIPEMIDEINNDPDNRDLTLFYDNNLNKRGISHTGTNLTINPSAFNKLVGFSTSEDTPHSSGNYAPYMVDLSFVRQYYSHTQFQFQNITSKTNQRDYVKQAVPITKVQNGLELSINQVNNGVIIDANILTQIVLKITNKNFDIFDFNGLDLNFTFQIDYMPISQIYVPRTLEQKMLYQEEISMEQVKAKANSK